jgi:hypothetical protein
MTADNNATPRGHRDRGTPSKDEPTDYEFIPSRQWQDLPDWAAVPPGGHYDMNIETGKNKVRWDNPPGPETVVDKRTRQPQRPLPRSATNSAKSRYTKPNIKRQKDQSESNKQDNDTYDRAGATESNGEKDNYAWFVPERIPDKPEPPPPQVIEGVLYRGGKFSLAGGAKAFKTWALSDQGFSISNGLDWWNIPTFQAPVLYLDFELMRFDFQQRMSKIRQAKGQGDFKNIQRIGLRGKKLDEALWGRLADIVKREGVGYVILDPVYKLFAGKDENSAGDVSSVLYYFESLAQETGAAIGYGLHFSKGNQAAKERGERGSGSGVFIRDPDAALEMVKHQAGDDVFAVESTLRSFPQMPPFVVRWNFPLFQRDETGLDPADLKPPKKPGGRPAEYCVDQLVEALQSNEMHTKELKKVVRDETGMSERQFYSLLTIAKEKGRIHQSKVDGKLEAQKQ